MSRTVLLSLLICFVVTQYVNGSLITGTNVGYVFTKDKHVPKDANGDNEIIPDEESSVPEDEGNQQEFPIPDFILKEEDIRALESDDDDLNDDEESLSETTTSKPCAEIGQFCRNHKDCCTNSCLGYMKRCVS